MIKVVAFGHSHLNSLEKGIQLSKHCPPEGGRFLQMWKRYDPFFHNVDGTRVYNPHALEDILKLQDELKSDVILASILGSEHFVISSASLGAEEFDVFVPTMPEAWPQTEKFIVPYDALRLQMYRAIEPYLSFLSVIKRAVDIPLYHIAPPPPVRDSDLLFSLASPDLQKKMIKGEASSWKRMKMWRIWVDIMQEICRSHEVAYLMPPAETLDQDGFLKPEFAADAVHASPEYGRIQFECLFNAPNFAQIKLC